MPLGGAVLAAGMRASLAAGCASSGNRITHCPSPPPPCAVQVGSAVLLWRPPSLGMRAAVSDALLISLGELLTGRFHPGLLAPAALRWRYLQLQHGAKGGALVCCSAGTRTLQFLYLSVFMPLPPAATLALHLWTTALTWNPAGYCATPLLRHPLAHLRQATAAAILDALTLPVAAVQPIAGPLLALNSSTGALPVTGAAPSAAVGAAACLAACWQLVRTLHLSLPGGASNFCCVQIMWWWAKPDSKQCMLFPPTHLQALLLRSPPARPPFLSITCCWACCCPPCCQPGATSRQTLTRTDYEVDFITVRC